MKFKTTVCLVAAGLMAMAPVSSAFAYGGHRDHWGHGGPLVGLVALGAAAVIGTAAILTAPINAVTAAAPAPQPYYAQPQAYAQPAYYAPRPYYYAQPAYYAPAPGYYYGR